MSLNQIGVISKQQSRNLSELSSYKAEQIIWFCEMESCFAYLLYKDLDLIFIDNNSLNDKYEKLIQQMYPHIKMHKFDYSLSFEPLKCKTYVPKLEELFLSNHHATVFQPIVKIKPDGFETIGFECLSRFTYYEQLFGPDFVFSYAQESLELQKYDELSLHRSIIRAPVIKNNLIFINVRPITLNAHNFEENLLAVLHKYNKNPQQIVIELTEQSCIFSENLLKDKCLNLKSLGFQIAIDDFGVGISNLGLVEIMSPNFIKISGKFVNDLLTDFTKQKIITNILELAHSLNIKAIVENIENQEQKALLHKLNASYAQGFLFSKPLKLQELLNFSS